MSEVLQSYLNAQHIKTADQENIDNLKKAVAEVKKISEKKKSQIVPYTLVALNPKIVETDPVVESVEAIVIKKWPTFRNSVKKTRDRSANYVRAVILESLSQLSKQDSRVAAIIWHSS